MFVKKRLSEIYLYNLNKFPSMFEIKKKSDK